MIMIAAEFLFDDQYVIESYARFRRQRKGRMFLMVTGGGAVVFLTCVSAYLIFSREFLMGCLPLLFMMIAVSAMMSESWSIKRRLRKSPSRGSEVRITFSEDSVDFDTSLAKSRLKWGGFTKVVYFEDGVLLFQGPYFFNWIPESSLCSGSADQLRDLLLRKITNHLLIGPMDRNPTFDERSA